MLETKQFLKIAGVKIAQGLEVKIRMCGVDRRAKITDVDLRSSAIHATALDGKTPTRLIASYPMLEAILKPNGKWHVVRDDDNFEIG